LLLPAFTNREDLQLLLGLSDDDTGQAINLAGITLQNPNGFTGSTWTVKDGSIVTSSNTTITIPPYPIGNQLSTLALTVGTGLGILPGDAVTILDPSGLNTMTGTVTSYVSATGALVCQIGMTYQFEIRGRGPRDLTSGFTPWFDVGVENDEGPLLSASLGNGIMVVDVSFIQILIREAQFKTLSAARSYLASLTLTDGVNTRQVFIGQLPVLWGGVTN
jgi:hypothetical protein